VLRKCPFCSECFKIEGELDKHISREHLSPEPKREYYAETWFIIKANNSEEVERILDYIVNIKLPKSIEDRISRWSYADEKGRALINLM